MRVPAIPIPKSAICGSLGKKRKKDYNKMTKKVYRKCGIETMVH